MFSDMASRGHQDHCTAAPVQDSEPGALGAGHRHLQHAHTLIQVPLWDTRWESYTLLHTDSCHVESGAQRALGPPRTRHICTRSESKRFFPR